MATAELHEQASNCGPQRHGVLVVDDHPLFREALKSLVASDPAFGPCAEAASLHEARKQLAVRPVALVAVDLRLGDGSGLDLIYRIRASGSRVPILVVTALDESLYEERAFQAGAQGFVSKLASHDRILKAFHVVASGGLWFPRFSAHGGIESALQRPARNIEQRCLGIGSLSDREMEVFMLIGNGRGTREIASLLDLSPHTIESHRERIRAKLGLRNSLALVQRAKLWAIEEIGVEPGDAGPPGIP